MVCVCGRFPLPMDSREQPQWVFRHVGPPATIPECVEVVELKEGAVTFGRGATADVYIDSLLLRNFISRRHAVVEGKREQDSHLHFVLHNYGLNGTYVNDVRIGPLHQLREGDRVTFGHKNGYKVKVGETAQQPDSEFQFVFEQCQTGTAVVRPLQEHCQQAYAKGKRLCLSDTDQSATSITLPAEDGPAMPNNCDQQLHVSPERKKRSGQRKSGDDLSQLSPSRASSEAPIPRLSRKNQSVQKTFR
ncbi:uncharacterized protein LOC143287781 [Babylonia areolata]|uniref:uncharacterized protein LOC143287781 n=1 Tax=Babylonia areolata TaxID=304850 RepID=UPI003FCF250D